MKKFVKKKLGHAPQTAEPFLETRVLHRNESLPPPVTRTDQLENQVRKLENENRTLKDATQKLLDENIELKETQALRPKNALSAVTQTETKEPSAKEIQALLQMTMLENDYLLGCMRLERDHFLSIKTGYLQQVDRLEADLALCQNAKKSLDAKLSAIRIDHDRLKTRCQLITDHYSQFVPIEDHKDIIKSCQALYAQLRDTYNQELAKQSDTIDKSHTELRRLAIEVARVAAELARTKNDNEQLRNELDSIREENELMKITLRHATEEKQRLEQTLKELVEIDEKMHPIMDKL